jgi:hypothetical protein
MNNDCLNWNQKILAKMMPNWWYKPWDLVSVYYDAPRRLRAMAVRGIVERKKENNLTYFKKLK